MGSAATASGKPSEWERVMGELTRGREIADQLLSILRKSRGDGASVVGTGVMVEKILESFTDSLSILSATAGTGCESDEVVSQISNLINSPTAAPKPEDSGESCKTPTPKDRRGCYKRRRTSETWTKETPTFYDDGHAWRKYGQKSILHSKHPRNYFRCTHKFDQGCQATKQVQKVQDEPTLYRTTYHDQHTCKKLNESSLLDNHHQLIMDATTHHNSAVIWSFQSSLLQQDGDYKINPKEVVTSHQQITKSSSSSLMSHNNNNNNNIHDCGGDDDDDYLMSPSNNYQQLAASDHLITGSSPAGRSDVMSSDVYSCCTSASPLSMDMAGIIFDDFPYL